MILGRRFRSLLRQASPIPSEPRHRLDVDFLKFPVVAHTLGRTAMHDHERDEPKEERDGSQDHEPTQTPAYFAGW
jgi:hypothetical protein